MYFVVVKHDRGWLVTWNDPDSKICLVNSYTTLLEICFTALNMDEICLMVNIKQPISNTTKKFITLKNIDYYFDPKSLVNMLSSVYSCTGLLLKEESHALQVANEFDKIRMWNRLKNASAY